MSKRCLAGMILVLVVGLGSMQALSQTLGEVAQSPSFPAMAPAYSDVVMRSLRFRDDSYEHGSTFQNVTNFHVTKLEWVYVKGSDAAYVEQFTNYGITVGHTVKGNPADASAAIENSSGEPLECPWMPNQYFLCFNKPAALSNNLDGIKLGIDLGCRFSSGTRRATAMSRNQTTATASAPSARPRPPRKGWTSTTVPSATASTKPPRWNSIPICMPRLRPTPVPISAFPATGEAVFGATACTRTYSFSTTTAMVSATSQRPATFTAFHARPVSGAKPSSCNTPITIPPTSRPL